MRKTALVLALAVIPAIGACKKTGENEFQVQTGDVDIKRDSATITVPDVDVVTDSAKIVTPDVDVDVKKDTSTVGVPKVRVRKP